jgi:DNA-binding CsgD family transcriptional regulator
MELAYNIGELSIDELSAGLKRNAATLSCIACGEVFELGRVYEIDGRLVDSDRGAAEHVLLVHGGALRMLAEFSKESTGLSEVQRDLLIQLSLKKSDREIARESHRSESTIRNQRFHLRRKINEAKVLCAVGELLEKTQSGDTRFISYHPDIPTADDRIMTTYAEEREITRKYFESVDVLKLERFPKKQKEKLVVLKRIAGVFTTGKDYTESEVNEVLIQIFSDYVTIRRYLIEYKFLEREPGGARYWVHVAGE